MTRLTQHPHGGITSRLVGDLRATRNNSWVTYWGECIPTYKGHPDIPMGLPLGVGITLPRGMLGGITLHMDGLMTRRRWMSLA